ncbi:MAG: iron-sulfur cluster repair di-iron protein [Leptospiraceae bacterium]|nr:iron-sulfur cluster repair di-iron protein [Leptospiraceae bacterium]
MEKFSIESNIATVVKEFPLSSKVFYKHGIDFCCGGNRSIGTACESKSIDLQNFLSELNESSLNESERKPMDLSKEELIDYILKNYHEPFWEDANLINHLSEKVARVHGKEHPELLKLNELWKSLFDDLKFHFQKEESILFPMIIGLERGDGGNMGCRVDGPIAQMEHEHTEVADILREMKAITNQYELPSTACNSYRALFASIQKVELELYEHIHLENNILHPGALKLLESIQGE